MPEFTLAVRLSADGSQLIGELKQSEVALDKMERGTKEVGRASVSASKDIDRMADQTDRMTGSTGSLTSGLFNLRNTIAALGIGALVRDIVQVGTQFESWESKIKLATGSSQAAASAIGFVSEEADRLGLSLAASIEGFSSLSVAAKGTAFEGQGVRDIFTAVSEASSVLRLSQEETSGVMRAFTQISSLAVLSMEEMQQLAERGVPANLLYARAFTELGLTTGDSVSQMLKLVSTGKVLSSDALPAITRELRKFVASGVEEAAESSAASFSRLSSAIFSLKISIAESGFIDFLANIAKGGVAAISTIEKLLIKLNLVGQEDSIKRINEEMDRLIERRRILISEIGQRNNGILPIDERRSEEVRREMFKINELLLILTEELRLVKEGADETSTSTDNLGGSLGGVSGKANQAAEGLSNVNAALKQFEESIITDAEETQILSGKIAVLDSLLRQNIITWEEYERRIEAVTGKQSEFSEEVEKTKAPVAEITELANPFADVWERAINEIDQSFVDLWKSAFDGFEDFADALQNTFRTLLAELAHAAITRPILVQLGIGGQLGGGGFGGGLFGGSGGAGGGFRLPPGLGLLGAGGSFGNTLNFGAGLLGGAGSEQAALLAAQTGEFGFSGASSTLGALGGPSATGASNVLATLGYGNVAALGIGLLGGLFGDKLFGEGGSAGASGGAAAGAVIGTAIFPGVGTALGALVGALAGGALFGGGKSRPTKIRAGAFPIGTDLSGNAGTTVTSPFGHELGFFGSRIGDDGQLSNEDYTQLVQDVTLLFQAVAEIDQLVIDTVDDLTGSSIGEQVEVLFNRARASSSDSLKNFLVDRFDILFTEIDEPLGELFNSLSEGMESGEIVALAAGFAGIFSAMEAGEPVFSDVADVTETISILFSDFVQEGETLIETLARLAQATQLLSLVGFDDTSLAGSLVAAETQANLGADRMAQLIDTYLGEFFTVEEILQDQLDNLQPKVDDLLSNLSTTAETFRTDFETILGTEDITGDIVAEWLEAAEGISIVSSLMERLNDLRSDEANRLSDQIEAQNQARRDEQEQVLAIHDQILGRQNRYSDAIGLAQAFNLANESLLDSIQRQSSEVLRLSFVYDGSIESAQRLAGATESLRQAELALLQQIDVAISSIDQSFGAAIFDIQLALLDTEGQYELLRTEAEALAQVLSTLTDPQEILQTAQQIQQLTSQAFGLLSDEQLQAVGGEFIEFLDSVSDTANSQLDAQREATLSAGEQVMEVVEASLNRAADRFHEAATRMANAGDIMANAAATMVVAANQPVQAQVIIQSDVVGL